MIAFFIYMCLEEDFISVLFFLICGSTRTIAVAIRKNSEIGLLKNTVKSPVAVKIAFLRLSSSIGPKIKAKKNGAKGKFVFLKKYPTKPKMIISQISKKL